MTIEQKAVEYADSVEEKKHWSDENDSNAVFTREEVEQAYTKGAKENGIQWHDLRKNPDDLPDEGTYLVVWQNARGYKEIMQMNYEEDDEEKLHWVDGDQDCWDDDIIAWCEIPTFDKE